MNFLKFLNKSENSVAVLVSVSILSLSFPYGFPLFGTLAFIFVCFKIISGKFKFRINIGFILFFLCILSYFLGMYLSQGIIYSNNISDILNIISMIFVWIILSDFEKPDYPSMLHKAAIYSVFTSLIVSLISLFKFYQLLNGVQYEYFFVAGKYSNGTSLVRDYNMFSFALLVGLILSVYLLTKASKSIHVLYYFISFIIIFVAVLFSGSRRAWVVLAILGIYTFIIMIRFLIKTRAVKIIKFGLILTFITVFITLFMNAFNIEIDSNYKYHIDKLKYRFETLKLSQSSDSFSQRTSRWDYAGNLYENGNPLELVIGSGFDYLPKYANIFAPDLDEDYPHNPILSSLLYAGLLGAIMTISLLFWSIVMAIKNFKLLKINFVFAYFISWIFILISSNSIFSVGLFTLLLLIIISIPKENSYKTPKTK